MSNTEVYQMPENIQLPHGKKGKWIYPYESTTMVAICSECGSHGRGDLYDICVNCGADMKGECE